MSPLALHVSAFSGSLPSQPVAGRRSVATAERVAYAQDGRPEERFGLGAFLVFSSRSLTGAGLVVPDDRPEVAKLLGPWCAARRVSTMVRPRPSQLLTLSPVFGLSPRACPSLPTARVTRKQTTVPSGLHDGGRAHRLPS
jgi:hypothetical protein